VIRIPRTRSCFVCGVDNPLGLGLAGESDGRVVRAPIRFRPEHIGLAGTVHGGLVATVLDELMVWSCGVVARKLAYCAELSVRYRRPVPPETPLLGLGEIVAERRDRLFLTRGELRDASGTLFAEATGKYIPVPGEPSAAMLADFLDDPTVWLGKRPS
jgi:acyl-coenzyme A thioesterase PaaI-like protein